MGFNPNDDVAISANFRLLSASREEAHLDLSLASSGVGQKGGEDSAVVFGDANSPTYQRTFQSARQIPGLSKRA